MVGLYFICWVGAFLGFLVLACPIGLIFGGLSGFSGPEGPRQALAALGGLGIFFIYGLFLLLSLALSLVFPAAAARVVLKEDLSAGFDYRAVFAFIRLNLGNYLLSLVVFILSNFLAQFGFILCCVGLLSRGVLGLSHPGLRDRRDRPAEPRLHRLIPLSREARVVLVLGALYLGSRLFALTALPLFYDETTHIRWAVDIASGERSEKLLRPLNYGKGLSVFLNALPLPLGLRTLLVGPAGR